MPFCTNLNCLHAQTCLRRAAVVAAAASAAASQCVREWASEQVNARASLGAPSRLRWPVCCCRCCLLPAFWTLFESQRVWERARERMHLRKKLVLQVIILPLLLTVRACACFACVFVFFPYFLFSFVFVLFVYYNNDNKNCSCSLMLFVIVSYCEYFSYVFLSFPFAIIHVIIKHTHIHTDKTVIK